MSLTWADKRKYLPLIMLFIAVTIITGCGGGGGDFWGQGGANTPTAAANTTLSPRSVTAADLTSAVTFTVANGKAPYTISVDQTSLVTLSTTSLSAAGTFSVTPITTKLTKMFAGANSSILINVTVADSAGATDTAELTYTADGNTAINISPATVTAMDLTSPVIFTIAKGTAPYTISVDQPNIVALSTTSLSAAGTFTIYPKTAKLTDTLTMTNPIIINVTVTDTYGTTSTAKLTYAPTKTAAYLLKMSPVNILYSTPKGDTGSWRRQILIMQLLDNNNNPASGKTVDVYFPYAGEDKIKVYDGSSGASNATIGTYGALITDSNGKAFLDVDFYTRDNLTYNKSFEASYNSQTTSAVTLHVTSDFFPEATYSFVPATLDSPYPANPIQDGGTWHTAYFAVTALDHNGDLINGEATALLPLRTYTRFTSAPTDSTIKVKLVNGAAVVGIDYYTQVIVTSTTNTSGDVNAPITTTTTTVTPTTYTGNLVLIYNGRSAMATITVH